MNKLTRGIKTHQTNIKALEHLIAGYKLARDMKFEEALKSFNKALRIKPNCAEAHTGKGSVFLKLRRYEESIKEYDLAIKFNPYDPAGSYGSKGLAIMQLERYEEAIIAFDKAIELDSTSALAAYQTKGKILQDLRRYDEAVSMYDQALSCTNINIYQTQTIMLSKVGIYIEQKKWDEAEAILEDSRLREVWEESKSLQNVLLAKCAYGKGEYEKSLKYCNEAIKLDNDMLSTEALHIKISCLIVLEQRGAIIATENAGLQRDMNDGWLLMSRAIRKIEEGDLEEAESCFKRAQRFGGIGGEKVAEIEICYFLMRAIQLEACGKYREAIESINEGFSHKLEFHRQSLLRHKAVCLNQIEYFAEALEYCDEFLAHDTSLANDPYRMEVLAEKARALHELGQYSAMHEIIGDVKYQLSEFVEDPEKESNGQVLAFPANQKMS